MHGLNFGIKTLYINTIKMIKLTQHNWYGTYKADITLGVKLHVIRMLQTTCEFAPDKGRISYIWFKTVLMCLLYIIINDGYLVFLLHDLNIYF